MKKDSLAGLCVRKTAITNDFLLPDKNTRVFRVIAVLSCLLDSDICGHACQNVFQSPVVTPVCSAFEYLFYLELLSSLPKYRSQF